MSHTVLKFLSILLILCVLAIGGLAQAQSVEHVGHHAQHQAATHGTLLCSWMCAAGHGLETVVVPTPPELVPLEMVELTAHQQPLTIYAENFPPRGPPAR